MSDTATPTGMHPIPVALSRLGVVLDAVADAPAWSLGAEQTRECLAVLARTTARVVELQTRLLTQAEEVDAHPGLSVAYGLAIATRQTRRPTPTPTPACTTTPPGHTAAPPTWPTPCGSVRDTTTTPTATRSCAPEGGCPHRRPLERSPVP